MTIEYITREDFKSAQFDFTKLEKKWRVDREHTDIDVLKKELAKQYEVVKEHQPERLKNLEWDIFMDIIKSGKVAGDIFFLYREKNELPKCPSCGSSYEQGSAALSRKDNKTSLCSDCGTKEAMDDYLMELKRKTGT